MNEIIIMIENGMVGVVYGTASVNVIVVDRDVIKRGDTLDAIMLKTVTFVPILKIHPDQTGRTVQDLVLHQNRPTQGGLNLHEETKFETAVQT